MKKIIIIIIILIAVFIISKPDEELRFRVIANSNSSFDQELKMEIAYRLKEVLEETQDLDIIKDKCEYIISKYKVNYDVNVEIKKHRFSAKNVDGKVVPGGVYKTLVVEIGEAEGKNYWTVLYPEFFKVGFEDVNSTDIEYKSWFIEKILGG